MAASGAHPNVVRYYSAWTEQQAEGQFFYILMEKCEVSLGTKNLLDGQPFREEELLDILRQVWTVECRDGMHASRALAVDHHLRSQLHWQDCALNSKRMTLVVFASALLDKRAAPWRGTAIENTHMHMYLLDEQLDDIDTTSSGSCKLA